MKTQTCERPMRDGPCVMDRGHRGRCSTVVHRCEGCGKTRRGRAHFVQEVRLGDGTVDDRFEFCFMCSGEPMLEHTWMDVEF